MKLKKTYNMLKKAIFFKEGIDIEFDNECKISFYNFLNKIELIIDTMFVIISMLCIYFFITH